MLSYAGKDYLVGVGRYVDGGRDRGFIVFVKPFEYIREYTQDALGIPMNLETWFTGVAGSPDGRYFAVSEFYNNLLLVAGIVNGKPVLVAKAYTSFPPTSVVWLNNNTIAVGEVKGFLELFSFNGSRLTRIYLVRVADTDIAMGRGLAYSAQSRILAVVDEDSNVYLYRVELPSGSVVVSSVPTPSPSGLNVGGVVNTTTVTVTVTRTNTLTLTRTVTVIRTVTRTVSLNSTRYVTVTLTKPVTVTSEKTVTVPFTYTKTETLARTVTMTSVSTVLTTVTRTVESTPSRATVLASVLMLVAAVAAALLSRR